MATRRKSVWTISLILALGFAVNYVDRGNLSVAGPLVQEEFALSPAQLGILFSAFFLPYALLQVPAGLLVDRLNLKWFYATAFVLWSLSSAAVAFAGSFLSLLLLRVLLGVGESVALPASAKVLATEFREEQRGIANGIMDSGSKFGPTLGILFGGPFIAHYGWRPLFLITGLVGLLWLIPWFGIGGSAGAEAAAEATTESRPEEGPVSPETPAPALTLKQILTARRAWGTFVATFCGGYAWYLMLTWLPSYLVMARRFPLTRMGVYGSLLFLASGLSAIATGFVADGMIRRGRSASKVRIRFAVAGLLLTTLLVPAGFAPTPGWALMFLFLAYVFYGVYSANLWAICQSIAGPHNVGRWSGIQNFVGNLGGVASPALTGWVVSVTGSFHWAFVIAAGVLVLGASIYVFVVKTLDPVLPASLPEGQMAPTFGGLRP